MLVDESRYIIYFDDIYHVMEKINKSYTKIEFLINKDDVNKNMVIKLHNDDLGMIEEFKLNLQIENITHVLTADIVNKFEDTKYEISMCFPLSDLKAMIGAIKNSSEDLILETSSPTDKIRFQYTTDRGTAVVYNIEKPEKIKLEKNISLYPLRITMIISKLQKIISDTLSDKMELKFSQDKPILTIIQKGDKFEMRTLSNTKAQQVAERQKNN